MLVQDSLPVTSNIFLAIPGAHFVELRVENDIGGATCTDSLVKQINVWNLPNPKFNAGITCLE